MESKAEIRSWIRFAFFISIVLMAVGLVPIESVWIDVDWDRPGGTAAGVAMFAVVAAFSVFLIWLLYAAVRVVVRLPDKRFTVIFRSLVTHARRATNRSAIVSLVLMFMMLLRTFHYLTDGYGAYALKTTLPAWLDMITYGAFVLAYVTAAVTVVVETLLTIVDLFTRESAPEHS